MKLKFNIKGIPTRYIKKLFHCSCTFVGYNASNAAWVLLMTSKLKLNRAISKNGFQSFHTQHTSVSSYPEYPYHGEGCKQPYEQRNQQVKHAPGHFFAGKLIQMKDPPQNAEGNEVVSLIR